MSFPKFTNFPAEIKAMIWTEALQLGVGQPTAHLLGLKISEGTGTVTAIQRFDNEAHGPDGSDATVNAFATLLKTCFASRRVSKRISNAIGLTVTTIHATTPSAQGIDVDSSVPQLPDIHMDLSVDLVVLAAQ